jgi:hypothetical protein
MRIGQGENGKAGEGQMAGPTHASANFDPIVSLVMSLLAPPAVRSNRIAQTPRTTARDRFLAMRYAETTESAPCSLLVGRTVISTS